MIKLADGAVRIKSNFANDKYTPAIFKRRAAFKKELAGALNGVADDAILKVMDSGGASKKDYDIIESKPVVRENKKEVSQKEKMRQIAAKLNSSKNLDLKQIAEAAGSNLWKWKPQVIDLVFENLNQFKN
jgi:hypothetical protein